ncbi:MAG: methyltransferase domain-containing protein, partial [Acinetobacter sp.]
MKWLQAIQNKLLQHKYAINAELLGDNTECAWTNLGYWDDVSSSYPKACQQLAEHLAQAVQLQSQDRVLDLGCGQGASLKYWLEHYQIQDLEAVELQQSCVNKIQQHIQLNAIHCQSFLKLQQISFQKQFDVVMCIDAAYHSDLNLFLNSANSVLN